MLLCGMAFLILVCVNFIVQNPVVVIVAFGFFGIGLAASMLYSSRNRSQFLRNTKAIIDGRGENAEWSEAEAKELKRKQAQYRLGMMMRLGLIIIVLVLLWQLV